MKNKVFVYGTLKKGGFFASRFDDTRSNLTPAWIKANLYGSPTFAGYPMMQHGDGVVHGELHEYDTNVIDHMDMIEGYNSEHEERSLFKRELITVTTDDGVVEDVYAYFYNQQLPDTVVHHTEGVWEI